MRRVVTLGAVAVTLAALALWAQGGIGEIAAMAEAAQRGFQAQMAQGLRALRAGEPGALAALWGLCFAYGFVHAVGPGHGKFLIGAYGAGTDAPLGRMVGLGLAASLAQGASAIALVYGGVLLFDASREALQIASDVWLERASLIAIALIGLWLMSRAVRKLMRQTLGAPVALAGGPAHAHDHTHEHSHGVCETCGHSHVPQPSEVAAVRNWRDGALLIGAIALRPCTGALFVLILTWRMGLVWQGMLAVVVMALGVASVTVVVAAVSVLAREGALDWVGRMGRARGLMPWLEAGAGFLILLVSLNMLKYL